MEDEEDKYEEEECPACGEIAVLHDGHCQFCSNCGWSLCSI